MSESSASLTPALPPETRATPRPLPRWLRHHGPPLVTFLLLLVAWQVLVPLLRVPPFILPPPSLIWSRTLDFGVPMLLGHLWTTLYEVVAGFALAVVVAIPLALLISSAPALRNTILPLLVSSQSIPKVAIAPLVLIWVGYGELPKIIIAALVAFFPVVVDTAQGLQLVPRELLDLAHSLTHNRLRIFFKIRFPAALPYFFASLKVAISLAVVGAVIGEFVGSNAGLGYLVLVAMAQANTALAFGALVLLSLLGIVLFEIVALVERLVCPWYAHD